MRGFRVYDTREKRMIASPSEESIFLSGNGNLVNINNTMPYLMDRYVRMDSTGLYDADNKEIYEGDILQVTCGCGHAESLPVCWRGGPNGYCLKATYQHDWDNGQLELKGAERDTKIIGNIYENPELISKVTI